MYLKVFEFWPQNFPLITTKKILPNFPIAWFFGAMNIFWFQRLARGDCSRGNHWVVRWLSGAARVGVGDSGLDGLISTQGWWWCLPQSEATNWAMKKNLGWLFDFGGYDFLPSYIRGWFHKPWNKDPLLKTTRMIQWKLNYEIWYPFWRSMAGLQRLNTWIFRKSNELIPKMAIF